MASLQVSNKSQGVLRTSSETHFPVLAAMGGSIDHTNTTPNLLTKEEMDKMAESIQQRLHPSLAMYNRQALNPTSFPVDEFIPDQQPENKENPASKKQLEQQKVRDMRFGRASSNLSVSKLLKPAIPTPKPRIIPQKSLFNKSNNNVRLHKKTSNLSSDWQRLIDFPEITNMR